MALWWGVFLANSEIQDPPCIFLAWDSDLDEQRVGDATASAPGGSVLFPLWNRVRHDGISP